MKQTIEHHVAMIVNDFTKMQHFYRDLLGFSIVNNGRRDSLEAAIALNLPQVNYHMYRAYAPSNDFLSRCWYLHLQPFQNQIQKMQQIVLALIILVF